MRHLLVILAASLGLLAALVTGKFLFEHRAASHSSGIGGAQAAAPLDYLFVGSSHTRQTYDVELLERRVGGSVFLVAYNALDYRIMELLVRTLTEDPARRAKTLVIEGYGMSLVRDGGFADSRIFFDSPPPLKLDLLRLYVAMAPGRQAYLDALDLIVNRNNELLLLYPINSWFVSKISYRGGYTGKVVPGLASLDGLSITTPRSNALPAQESALRQMIHLARERGIRVVSIASPMPGPVERQPSVVALKTQLSRLLAEQDVPYLDGAADFPLDDPTLFADSNHLSTAGRTRFTEAAARFLDRQSANRK